MLQQLENSRLLTCSRPLHIVCVRVNVGSFLLQVENLFDPALSWRGRHSISDLSHTELLCTGLDGGSASPEKTDLTTLSNRYILYGFMFHIFKKRTDARVTWTGKFANIGLVSWEVPSTSLRYHPQPPSGGVPKSRWCRFQRRDAQCLIAETLGAAGAAMEMVSFDQNLQILKHFKNIQQSSCLHCHTWLMASYRSQKALTLRCSTSRRCCLLPSSPSC